MESLDLTSLLVNLQLQPSSTNSASSSPSNSDFSTFHLFPNLPAELRLKILAHALPIHAIIPLKAYILLSDPSFGLYLTFIVEPTKGNKLESIFSSQKPEETVGFKESRALGLMQVNHEFHDFYIQHFPLTLPSSRDGTALAKVRFSPHETIYLKNFDKLLGQPAFIHAMRDNYRLQTFWYSVEILMVSVVPLLYRATPSTTVESVVRKFEGLKVLELRMWEFEGGVGEGMKSVRDSVETHLVGLRERLRKTIEAEEQSSGYVIPELVLV